MLPVVSPGKTWEGVAAEVTVYWIGVSVLFLVQRSGVQALDLPPLNYGQYVLYAAVLATMGIIGDLCESFVKRAGGAKDSGTFFPGHGGVLDRWAWGRCAWPVCTR